MILRIVNVEDTKGNETWRYSLRELQKDMVPRLTRKSAWYWRRSLGQRLETSSLDIISGVRTIKQANSWS